MRRTVDEAFKVAPSHREAVRADLAVIQLSWFVLYHLNLLLLANGRVGRSSLAVQVYATPILPWIHQELHG